MNAFYVREALAGVGLLTLFGIIVCACLHWYVT